MEVRIIQPSRTFRVSHAALQPQHLPPMTESEQLPPAPVSCVDAPRDCSARSLGIPKITDERLCELSSRIEAVVRDDKGVLRHIEPCDLRYVAFTWDPKLTRKAANLVEVATIRTLHAYGYYGFFKPSIAEVIAQIPGELIERVAAFETIGPATADDLNEERAALNAGFHVGSTHLYEIAP